MRHARLPLNFARFQSSQGLGTPSLFCSRRRIHAQYGWLKGLITDGEGWVTERKSMYYDFLTCGSSNGDSGDHIDRGGTPVASPTHLDIKRPLPPATVSLIQQLQLHLINSIYSIKLNFHTSGWHLTNMVMTMVLVSCQFPPSLTALVAKVRPYYGNPYKTNRVRTGDNKGRISKTKTKSFHIPP